jgi:glycosyltransferase involved in cell wall biosynthesis
MPRATALRALGLAQERRYVGFLGALTPWQGVDIAIRALGAVLQRHHDVILLIGGDGEERSRLMTLATELGVGHRVRFQGVLAAPDVKWFLGCLDLAIAPKTSRVSELGLAPLKVREYAAAGCPTLLPALPGLQELAESGWVSLHKPHDPADLARVLILLLDAPQRLTRMRDAARAYAEVHYSWDVTVTEILRQATTEEHGAQV